MSKTIEELMELAKKLPKGYSLSCEMDGPIDGKGWYLNKFNEFQNNTEDRTIAKIDDIDKFENFVDALVKNSIEQGRKTVIGKDISLDIDVSKFMTNLEQGNRKVKEVIGKHILCDCERCLSSQSKGTWLN